MESLIGKEYNCWTVIALVRFEGRRAIYKVRCACGVEREKPSGKIGKTFSCGCQNYALTKGHGKTQIVCDSGIRPKEPSRAPSFVDVTHAQFQRVPASPVWLIMVKGKVIDRQSMSRAERRVFEAAG